MNEWTIVGVIVVLVGLGISIITPIVKLNSTITRLTTIVERLGGDVADLTARNSKTHDRIFDRLDDHDGRLNAHETRISVLENGGNKNDR